MNEQQIRDLVGDVREGRLPRRGFIQHMVAAGLTAPMASMLLMHEGIAQTAPGYSYKPTKRGGGGAIKLIYWQAAVHLNPHYAGGTKDQDASRIFYEPLAGWDTEGNLVPFLAAEIPSRANGGLAADGKSVVWKLKRGVKWHDGRDFTADDVVFTAQYAGDPAAAMTTIGTYKDIKVTKVDSHTVRVEYPQADAVLGRGPGRHGRHDPAQACVRALHGRQVAREPGQHEAGGHRAVQDRRVQAGRHAARRGLQGLPRPQPAVLRRAGGQGRRRRHQRRARGAADRRIRPRLEPGRRGRDPQAPGSRRQGQDDLPHRQRHRVRLAATSPTPGTRSTASAPASRASTRHSATRQCAMR
jgi:hypothetical protein